MIVFLPTRCTNSLFEYIYYTPLHVSSTIMLIFRRTIVLTQHLVSLLSLGDCSVHRLREEVTVTQYVNSIKYVGKKLFLFQHYHHNIKQYKQAIVFIFNTKMGRGAFVTSHLSRSEHRYSLKQTYWKLSAVIFLRLILGTNTWRP